MFLIFPNLSIFPPRSQQNRMEIFPDWIWLFGKSYKSRGLLCCRQEIPNGFWEGRGELKSGIVEIFTNYAIFMCVFSIALILDVSTVCSAGVSLTCCVCARPVASMFVFCVFARLCQSCGSRLNRKLVAKRKHDDTQWEKILTEIVSDELQTSPVTQFLEAIFMWK